MNSFVFHSELWREMNSQGIRYLIRWNFITSAKGKVKINSLPLGYRCSQVRQQNESNDCSCKLFLLSCFSMWPHGILSLKIRLGWKQNNNNNNNNDDDDDDDDQNINRNSPENSSGYRWVYFLSFFRWFHILYTSSSNFEFDVCRHLFPATHGYAFEGLRSALPNWGKWYNDDTVIQAMHNS